MEFYYCKVCTMFGGFKFKSSQALSPKASESLMSVGMGRQQEKVCGCFGGWS